MPIVGSEPAKRAHAHYRWAKRYAAERDEPASLDHLRRAIHYTTSGQRFGGGGIERGNLQLDPKLETWDTMVGKYHTFSVRVRNEDDDGKVWMFPRRADKDKGKAEYEYLLIGGYWGKIVKLEDQRLREEWPMLTLIKCHIREHRALDDLSLEKNEMDFVAITLRSGGGSETQNFPWHSDFPLGIFETLFYFVPKFARELNVDPEKIKEMRTALEKVELSIWRIVQAVGSPMKRANRENVSSERE
jgi:hypothetical protein